MTSIDFETIKNQIKDKIKITDLASKFGMNLKNQGDRYQGECKYHKSKNKNSFVTYDNKGFTCFSAGCPASKGGDIFDLVMINDTCDFSTALRTLSEMADVPLERLSEEKIIELKKEREEENLVFEIQKEVADFYHKQIDEFKIDDKTIREFEKELRGFSDQTINDLRIGYADTENKIVPFLLKKYGKDDLLKTGLFIKCRDTLLPLFQGRIIYPYFKHNKVVRFIARKTKKTPKNQYEEGKYKKQFSPGKGKTHISKAVENKYFYGEDTINKSHVIITEGITDCISLIQAGFSSISPVTVRFRKEDYQNLLRLVKNMNKVFIMNDNEENNAGKEGALETAKYLFSNGIQNVRLCELPRDDGKDKVDVNEYLSKMTIEDANKSIKKLLDESKHIIDLLIEQIPSDIQEKKKKINDIIEILNCTDSFISEQYLNVIQEKAGIGKKELYKLFSKIKTQKREKKKEDINNFLDVILNKDGNPVKTIVDIDAVADYIIEKLNIRTIYDVRIETIEIYEEGIWKPSGKGVIVSEIENILSNYAKNSVVSEILEKIKRKTEVQREDTEDVPDFKVPLLNCVLDLENIENIKRLEHDPGYNFRKKFPVKYDPLAKCPNCLEFIEKTFYPCDVPQVQEYGGMHLVRRYLFKKAVICQGSKNTGKSVYLNLLSSFCGKNNISGLSLQKMAQGKSFDLLVLKDSFANIHDDLSSKDLCDSGNFKMATGDGDITGEIKFGDHVRFRNTAKHTFACNSIPPVKNIDDDAYYDRWLVWNLENVVPKSERNPKLIEQLTSDEELSGLLNWYIEGYKRLITQNRFSNEKTCEEIKDLMIQNSNTLARFTSEVLECDPESKLEKDELYNSYCNWCLNQKPQISPDTKDKIGKTLTKFAPFIADRKSGSIRYWGNVKIRDKWDSFQFITTHEKSNNNSKICNNISQKNIDIYFPKVSQQSQICPDEKRTDVFDIAYQKLAGSREEPISIQDIDQELNGIADVFIEAKKKKGDYFEPKPGYIMKNE